MNIHPSTSNEECIEAFENIETQTIERFNTNYIKFNGDPQYRLVNLGVWTVDIKLRLSMLTEEPENLCIHR